MQARTYERTIRHREWDEVYLTAAPREPVSSRVQLEEIFEGLASQVAARGASVLHEKVFGLCSDRDVIEGARARAFERNGLDAALPVTVLEGEPCVGGVLAGVQLGCVVPRSPEVWVEPVTHRGVNVGRALSLPDRRLVHFSGVSGHDPTAPGSVTEQAQRMFDRAFRMLAACGLTPRHVVRTWIYMPRILDWYGEFNRVRTACFRDAGLLNGGGGRLPASTGIQARRGPGEECFMDVLAVQGDGPQGELASVMHNVRQNEAYDYGSSFSRGMAVGDDAHPTLHVSGTASIDTRGRTVHHDDEQGQIIETLLDVAALLEGRGASLRDICLATAYCKRTRDHDAFERIARHLDLADLPVVAVLADVCRDELLFELDAVAVTGAEVSHSIPRRERPAAAPAHPRTTR